MHSHSYFSWLIFGSFNFEIVLSLLRMGSIVVASQGKPRLLWMSLCRRRNVKRDCKRFTFYQTAFNSLLRSGIIFWEGYIFGKNDNFENVESKNFCEGIAQDIPLAKLHTELLPSSGKLPISRVMSTSTFLPFPCEQVWLKVTNRDQKCGAKETYMGYNPMI